MREVAYHFNAICQHSPSIYRKLPRSHDGGPRKMGYHGLVVVRDKNESASIIYLSTGHLNMSHKEIQIIAKSDGPKISRFYIYEFATPQIVALKWLINKQKKGFAKLSLTLF
jgi:hypothetical protein